MLFRNNKRIIILVSSANKVQLSEDARNALTPFDCYVMTRRGEVDIKVRLNLLWLPVAHR